MSLPTSQVPDWVLRTYDSQEGEGGTTLRLSIDATHSGRITNNRVYPGRKMKAGASSFTSTDNGGSATYDKPILKHHDSHNDAVGRVVGAKFIPIKSGKEFTEDFLRPDLNGPGSGYIRLNAEIADADSIQKLLDGRFQTVSTGQSSNKMTCSICDKRMVPFWVRYESDEEDFCQHSPGQVYKIKKDGKGRSENRLCFAVTGDLEYHEVSFVNNPADSFAQVVKQSFGDSSETDGNEDREIMAIEDMGNSPVLSSFRIYDAQGAEVKPLKEKKIQSVVNVDWKEVSNVNVGNQESNTPSHDGDKEPSPRPGGDDVQDDGEEQAIVEDSDTSDQVGNDSESSDKSSTASDSKNLDEKRSSTMDDNKVEKSDVTLSADKIESLIQATTDQRDQLKSKVEELNAQIDNLKKTVGERDESIADMQKRLDDQASDAVKVLSSAFVASSVILGRKSVEEVKDRASFDAKVADLAERSLDSLRDSLADSVVEVMTKLSFDDSSSKNNGEEGSAGATAESVLSDKDKEPGKATLEDNNKRSEKTKDAVDSLIDSLNIKL